MRGSVVRKGNRWYVVVDERDEDGSRRRRWHSGYDTRREAEQAAAEIVHRITTGRYVAPSRLTVESWLLEEWLPEQEPNLARTTWALYRTQCAAYVVPRIGPIKLTDLRPEHLRSLYRELSESGGRGGKPLAPKTVRNVARMLHRALQEALELDLIPRNPAAAARGPRLTGSDRPKTWSADQLAAFLEHVESDLFAPLVHLIATTGMRRSEALGLTWDCVDLDSGTVEITKTLVEIDGTPTISPTTKTRGSRRLITLDAATVARLRGFRREVKVISFDGLVFPALDGGPVQPAAFTRWFQARAAEIGLPQIGPHGLRHTWATLALRAGVHPKAVAERLGHSSIRTTLDRYSHAIPEMDREAAETVAALIRR